MVLDAAPDKPATTAGHLALPRAFGPYELVEEIGRGGMGVVYAAWQPALGRTVAVKLLIAGGFASEPALRRFQLEAAAAAKLQHPNIVAIHDYGEVDGQPYYAMDLVTGRNMAELCAGRPLPVRRAADFLRLLARAVHYAHERGILHRDLKPSNVLVDEEERPRITDFGLAKMLGSTAGATLTGQMLGSPSYAATEQVAGRGTGITAASDVYGLGALFYHLVTGRAPFNAATPTETARLVLETDPPPPRLLNPGLPRDLETICLKCLEKEPGRRYASAAEVAEDIERFLSERPIGARPPGATYRMGKFVQRHRTAVAAAAAVLLALVAGLGLALLGFRRAVVQQRATDAARGQAEGLLGLMTHDLTPILEQRGGLRQMLKTIEAAVHYYETLPPELRTTKTDQAQADALYALANLRARSLNDRKGAWVAAKVALVLREKIARENPDDPEAAAASLECDINRPDLGDDTVTDYSEARMESLIRRARELHARFPSNPHVSVILATMLGYYAELAVNKFNKPSEAKVAVAECQTIADQLMAGGLKDKVPGHSIGWMLWYLADGLALTGESASAAAVLEQGLAYFTEALKVDPGNLMHRFQVALATERLSYNSGTLERERDMERSAREHYRVLIQMDPDNQWYQSGYARTHSSECWYLFNKAPDFDAAPKAFREYFALRKPGYDEFFACTRLWLAIFAAWAGKPADARQAIEQTQVPFADYCSRLPESSNLRCNARVNYLSVKSYAFYWLRDWPAMAGVARECLAEIETGLRRKPGNGPLLCRQADANVFLAIAAQHEGRSAEAIARLPPLIKFIRGATSNDYSAVSVHTTLGIAQKALTESFVQQGDREQARQAAEQLLLGSEIWSPNLTDDHDLGAGALTLAASLCDSSGAVRCIGLVDRAKTMLTSPAAIGRLTVYGKENLATIARLRVEAAANLTPEALEKAGRELDVAAATDSEASEQFTQAGEAAWNFLPNYTTISSKDAREVELAARESYRALMARSPDNQGYRFLFAETHRMECYVHFGWDGKVEPAREAFRQYDALLETFVGRKGYDSVLRTRLENSLHLAQLAASVGDKADAERWLAEARKRFEAYRDRLPERSPDRGLAGIRFLEVSAWTAWWLRDWPELAQLAHEAQAECKAGLKEQPASEELLKRQAMADGFAALAVAGTGSSAEAATKLRAARDRLKTTKETESVYGVCDGDTVVWAIEYAWIEALRKNGDLAQAKNQTRNLRYAYEGWVPSFPEYWRAQKHLAILRLLEASILDPAIPFEVVNRKELLDQAAAALAPEKVAGRLTVDVQEALRELERLRAATAPQSR
jgi:hypothetical protein